MSLFSLGLLAAYFAAGMKFMMLNEGWAAEDAFYFWAMTVSTVGYGDLAPTTPKTQAFVSVYAIVGLVLVWSIVSDYYGVVQGKLQDFQANYSPQLASSSSTSTRSRSTSTRRTRSTRR